MSLLTYYRRNTDAILAIVWFVALIVGLVRGLDMLLIVWAAMAFGIRFDRWIDRP